MSTNDPVSTSNIAQLSVAQKRAHLEHLLDTRWDLAVTAVEQLSHNLESADETFARLLEVEDAIKAQFPDRYAEAWPRWVHDDARRLHGPGVLDQECSVCQQIATAKGIHLGEPEAA